MGWVVSRETIGGVRGRGVAVPRETLAVLIQNRELLAYDCASFLLHLQCNFPLVLM